MVEFLQDLWAFFKSSQKNVATADCNHFGVTWRYCDRHATVFISCVYLHFILIARILRPPCGGPVFYQLTNEYVLHTYAH